MNSFKYLLGKICGCPWRIFYDYITAFFLLNYKNSLYIEDNNVFFFSIICGSYFFNFYLPSYFFFFFHF